MALAEAVGVTSNTVARWERGEMAISEPAARLLQKIAAEQRPRVGKRCGRYGFDSAIPSGRM